MKRKQRVSLPSKPKPRKVTPQESIAHTAQQDHSHLHSIVIRKKRDLLQFEADQLQESISALTKALVDAKISRERVWARIVGLSRALEVREVGGLFNRPGGPTAGSR